MIDGFLRSLSLNIKEVARRLNSKGRGFLAIVALLFRSWLRFVVDETPTNRDCCILWFAAGFAVGFQLLQSNSLRSGRFVQRHELEVCSSDFVLNLRKCGFTIFSVKPLAFYAGDR